MCPQTPRLSPEYSHKAGLQTVITEMPLQIRPVTRSGHAGPVTMGRITRGPLCWTRPHGGMTSSPVFVRCHIWGEGCPCPLSCLRWTNNHDEGLERRVASSPSPQHQVSPMVHAMCRRIRGSAELRLVRGAAVGITLPCDNSFSSPRLVI
jgi:hypothetical protein